MRISNLCLSVALGFLLSGTLFAEGSSYSCSNEGGDVVLNFSVDGDEVDYEYESAALEQSGKATPAGRVEIKDGIGWSGAVFFNDADGGVYLSMKGVFEYAATVVLPSQEARKQELVCRKN